MMRLSIQRRLLVTVTAIALGIALPALAQKVIERSLRGNPYRDVGGSCVYGRQGELMFAPKGVRCSSLQEAAPDETEAVPSDRFTGISPTLRAEISTLLESHAHVAEELAELRRAVAEGRTADALQASDHLSP